MNTSVRVLRPFWLFLALSLAALPGRAQTNANNAVLPPHPRLLLDADGLAQLKQRINTAPWAKASWAELKAEADKELAKPVVLPPRGGNWSHNYVCPTHGARLRQGKQIGPWQWEHICPVGNHVLKGDPSKATLDFDGVAIGFAHDAFARQIVNHGLVYQVTRDERHARKAREILLAYAERYLDYPLHDNNGRPGKGGRVASQYLSEAVWLVPFTQGADLVWDTLSDTDRRGITEKVIRPALDTIILPARLGIHNIQCHLDSAIGLSGYLLDDRELIDRALNGPSGIRAQLEQGVLADGMWLEGSTGYHFYTIQGLWPLIEAARHCGVNLYAAKFQSMFDGPLALAMPDFELPDFNDSASIKLQSEADLYELAFARFHNPAYASMLAQSNRRGRLALFYGETRLPSGARAGLASRNSPASGYAMLQQGPGRDATWLCLKYGPHGGGHGHPDKNHFILYSRGKIIAPDAGTHAYGSPLHGGWDKTTFAHNTLVVDETSQSFATGKCLAFGNEHGVDYAVTDAGPIYRGVRFTRAVALLTPQLIVFVDQVQADKPHTFDLIEHQVGEWENLPPGDPWSPPAVAGYKYVTGGTQRAGGADGLTLKTKLADDWRPALTLANNEATQIITGYGLLKSTEDRVPLVIQRRHAQRAAYAWAISLDGAPVTLRVAPVTDAAGQPVPTDEAALVQVTANNNDQHWSLLVNPGKQKVSAPFAGAGAVQTDAAFEVR